MLRLQFLYHMFDNKELSELSIAHAMHTFASSLVSLFVPMILYTLGYALEEVFLYAILTHVFALIFFFVAIVFVKRYGIKHTIILSVPFHLLFYYLMFTIAANLWSVWLLALVFALYTGFYWCPWHFQFLHNGKQDSRGRQFAGIAFASAMMTILAPLLGGSILSSFSEQELFIASGIVVLVSVVPLLLTRDRSTPASVEHFWKCLRLRSGTHIAFFCEGLRNGTAGFVWPLSIFLVQGGFLIVGSIYAIVHFVVAVMHLLVGKLSDTNPQKLLQWGSIGDSIIFATRGFVVSSAALVTTWTSLAAISFVSLNIPYMRTMYNLSAENPAIVLWREVMLNAGRIGLLTFAFIVLTVTGNPEIMMFSALFVAAVSSQGIALIHRA